MSGKRVRHSLEENVQAVEAITKQGKVLKYISKDFDIHPSTLEEWIYKYESKGIDGLKESRTWKKYCIELKLQAVQDYLDGKYSLKECCRKYDISDTKVLREWIKRYTSGEAIKSTGKGRTKMSKGRKTTYKERIEIAQYCLAIDKHYQKTADKFQVSYQQVYQWVQKYEQGGEEALVDRRGRNLSSKPQLTEEDRLKLKNKELKERNQYLEAEIGLLKKLEEIERRENPHK